VTLIVLGCIARAPEPLPGLEPGVAPEGDALVVRLHFGPEADLDLHVTDPDQETVYFGNNPSLGGGVLEADLRCDAPAPRTEVVHFAAPKPGRYRVGVDFITPCRRVRDPVPFEIEVTRGEVLEHLQGEARPNHFDPNALEFDLPR
jgi:hypothetical protein